MIGEHGTTTEMFLAWFGDSKLGGSTCIGKTGKIGKIGKRPRGFNGSANIPESCDFRSQFDPLNIIF